MAAALLLSALLLLPLATHAAYTCDFQNDECPYRNDGVCDSRDYVDCRRGDCEDCDPCRVYDYECGRCVSNGCFYCPGDAKCWSSDSFPLSTASTCQEPSDYVPTSITETCGITSNAAFR